MPDRRHTPCYLSSRLLPTRIWQKLLKIVQQIRCPLEKSGDLRIHLLNRTLFTLIRLQNLEEILIYVGLIRKSGLMVNISYQFAVGAHLYLIDIVDGMVELDGRFLALGSSACCRSLELGDLTIGAAVEAGLAVSIVGGG